MILYITFAASFLTTVVCLLGFISLMNRYDETRESLILPIALMVGITGLFGVANLMKIDADWLLYPIRIAMIGYAIWIVNKLT